MGKVAKQSISVGLFCISGGAALAQPPFPRASMRLAPIKRLQISQSWTGRR
jgi:hypothetical protein